MIDWLIDWIGFCAVSPKFQPSNGFSLVSPERNLYSNDDGFFTTVDLWLHRNITFKLSILSLWSFISWPSLQIVWLNGVFRRIGRISALTRRWLILKCSQFGYCYFAWGPIMQMVCKKRKNVKMVCRYEMAVPYISERKIE